MSSKPTLPVTTTTTSQSNPSTTISSQSQPPIANPAFRSFILRIATSLRHGFSLRRPWAELMDHNYMSKPETLTEACSRIRINFNYFRVNYVTLIAVVLAFSLVTHPFTLLVLTGLLASWLFLYLYRPSDQPLILFGRTFAEGETLGMLVVLTLFVIFLTSVGSLLTSALMVGFAIVCAHGAFRVPDDLFLDNQEPASAGFLSILGGAASSTAASAASAAVSRV